MVKPISPKEATTQKRQDMPDAVIETWNRLIAKKFNGNNSVTIKQNEIVAALAASNGVDRQTVFDLGWLDIEDLYRSVGWTVEYDKPGYNESYEAFFVFKKKKRS